MVARASHFCSRWGWLGAVTCLSLTPGCRSDEAGSNAGFATTQQQRSRVSQQRVKEPIGPDDAAEPGQGELLLHQFGADAATLSIEPLKRHSPLGADLIHEREGTGLVLDVEWKAGDLPAPAGSAETSVEGLEEARDKTRLRMRIFVAQMGRLNVTFLGQGFPWPSGTAIRARADRYGQLLVWPDQKTYRNVVPGALRALFADRRLDLGPLFVPKQSTTPPSHWLGLPTVRSLMTTPVAEIQLDQAIVPGSGLGAALLCRLLVELAGVEPDNLLCQSELLPLHAQITNAPGGKLAFAVTAIGKKQELEPAALLVPPLDASVQTSGLPGFERGSIDRGLLSGLRLRAAPANPPASRAANAPRMGLVAKNNTQSLRALLVDGVTVAWLPAGAELSLPELQNGTYSIAWRDFFGTAIESSRAVVLPARVTVGSPQEPSN